MKLWQKITAIYESVRRETKLLDIALEDENEVPLELLPCEVVDILGGQAEKLAQQYYSTGCGLMAQFVEYVAEIIQEAETLLLDGCHDSVKIDWVTDWGNRHPDDDTVAHYIEVYPDGTVRMLGIINTYLLKVREEEKEK